MAYARQIETARRLIVKYGGPAIVRVTTTVTDPDDEWNPQPDTVQDEPTTAVFLNYEQRYIDGTVVHAGDMRVLLASVLLNRVPNLQGSILRTVGGFVEKWKIMDCSPLNVNGLEPILYKLQVRL